MNKKNVERLKITFGLPKDESFEFGLIEKYFRKKEHSNVFQTLTDKTCNDLDFNDLFVFVDRTTSKIGQQYLYDRIRTIPENNDHTALHERIISEFSSNENFRIDTQIYLDKLKKSDAYYVSSLFQEEQIKPPKWFFMIPLLSVTSLVSIVLLPFIPKIFILLLAVIIVNLGIHYWNKKNLYQYLVSIPQLLKLNEIATKLAENQLLKELNPRLAHSTRIIRQISKRMSFFQLEAHLQGGDIQALFWTMLELVKIVFLFEPLLLFGVLKRLETKRKELEDVFCFVGQVDMLVSIASLRNGLTRYCMPVIQENGISAAGMYHPLIENCVPNNIEVGRKSVLLTGSNMSGKTSFIRAVGINIIAGLTMNTCFAASLAMPRFRVFSAIRISDDLLNDKSYYFEEVLTIKEMIRQSRATGQNLFLLDEIFKGTNTVERIAAGKATLSYLSANENVVFVSTHDVELADFLHAEYDLYHFSEIVDDKNVAFDYKLKEGKLKNRNAIRILQINDYPESIIDDAIKISQQLDEK